MLFFPKNAQHAKQLAHRYHQHQLRKIHRGLYTDDLESPVASLVLQHWMSIVSYLVPQGILSYQTALKLKPLPFKGQHIVFITSTYNKTLTLPGLIIKIYQGDCQQYIEHILPNLARSNTARMLLENLAVVRGADYIGIKTIGAHGVEKYLAKELNLRGENHLNLLREQAKQVAATLSYDRAFSQLNRIISALLCTHNEDVLVTPYAKATVQNKPYDEHRIQLFDELVLYLKKCRFLDRPYEYHRKSFKNLSFYESYFSNFIEGTEFVIDEAEDIIFQGKTIHHRHADSHDVLSHFMLSNDYSEMTLTPSNPESFIDILQRRHALLMKERPEKTPGEFKQTPNKAGNTYFVSPKETIGTLYQGFQRYQILNPGLEKALFMHFLITEVHPFQDGNGRLSRIMMNAELVSHSTFKIIIPSVHRDNYLNGLRLASRDHQFRTYIKVMDQAHAYTALLPWEDYTEARSVLETHCAHLTADEGIPIFNRTLRQLRMSELAI